MALSLLSRFFQQAFFIPQPQLTEANLPDQTGKVVIITGGYAGVGQKLAQILYDKNATVYIAGRSKSKADQAIAEISSARSGNKGSISFLELDLSDLTTIKPAAESFLAKESRLDVLINNAGVMVPPKGSKSTQGHELQIGTNCLGPFLFTKLLLPTMEKTAASAPTASVRVAWAGSFAVDALSPSGGITFDGQGEEGANVRSHPTNQETNYGMSKVGNLYLATEFARRYPQSPVIHTAFNPGNLKTSLQRHSAMLDSWIIEKLILYPAVYGAYTELFAGWSEEVTPQKNGAYVWPWGRFGGVKADVQKEIDMGENGKAGRFWAWCEKETRSYV